jgi:hypothetical protein
MHFSRVRISLCFALLPVTWAHFAPHSSSVAQAKRDAIAVTQAPYHGWPDALTIRNSVVEVTVVPSIARVMQFQHIGEAGVFWENRTMDGKAPDPSRQQWGNFGGDKSWPSPQDDWNRIMGREWPPPTAFDSMPHTAQIDGAAVIMTSPVDPAYGIRTLRRIELSPGQPVMTIVTTYEKVRGDPVKVGIGVITQLRDPQRAFIVRAPHSRFARGYVQLQFGPPHDLKVVDGLISLVRGHDTESQIGSDGSSLLWMNDKYVLRIESPRIAGAEYADQGSSVEIFTSKDPLAYVELETFGPLQSLRPGERLQRTNRYTLLRRTRKDPFDQALVSIN